MGNVQIYIAREIEIFHASFFRFCVKARANESAKLSYDSQNKVFNSDQEYYIKSAFHIYVQTICLRYDS